MLILRKRVEAAESKYAIIFFIVAVMNNSHALLCNCAVIMPGNKLLTKQHPCTKD